MHLYYVILLLQFITRKEKKSREKFPSRIKCVKIKQCDRSHTVSFCDYGKLLTMKRSRDMGIFFILFIILMFGNNKGDNRNSQLFKTLIIGSIVMSVISTLMPALSAIAFIAIIIYLVSYFKKKKKSAKRQEKYGWDPQRWDEEQGNQGTYEAYREVKKSMPKEKTLPQAAAKRKKIVEAFNEKYKLDLTAAQIQGIVNSTYMSEIWRKEVEAMNRKYETLYEWFQGYTKWLRVYMHVFHVQEITSDIRQQENICMYAFDEVFRYADLFPDLPLHEKIQHVNEKFYTSFDDVSFMIAYRFLESKGRHHELGNMDLVREDEKLDQLLEKYKTSEKEGIAQ